MKENVQPRSKGLEMYKKWNKLTLAGSLGVAVLVPPLAAPALAMAAVDGAQIYAINRVNKKKEVQQSRNGFAKVKDIFVAKEHPMKKGKNINAKIGDSVSWVFSRR